MSPEERLPGSIWDKSNLALTLGSILAVTLGAFQGLAVATIAPVLAEDLNGRDYYGWIFAAFILPQIIGTILAGHEVDRRQPAIVFYTSMAIFGIGTLIAGLEDTHGIGPIAFNAGTANTTLPTTIPTIHSSTANSTAFPSL